MQILLILFCRSLAEISRSEIKTEEIDKLLLSIFASCGFQDKEVLTYNDFNYLLQNYRDELLGTGTDRERGTASCGWNYFWRLKNTLYRQ